MNEIAVFNKLKVRINYKNQEPYFVAQDICKALFISNPSQALKDLDKDEKHLILSDIISNDSTSKARKTQSLLHVSESGVYSLILKSRKKEAKDFKKWVTKEVLPTIRKTGSYSLSERSENWLQKRQEGKGIRKAETDVINKFIDYAILQGANKKGAQMYYSTFTKEVYKILDVNKGERDNISGLQLYQLSLLEMTISNSLIKSMDSSIHYKEAYKQAKKDFIQVAELAGFKTNKELTK